MSRSKSLAYSYSDQKGAWDMKLVCKLKTGVRIVEPNEVIHDDPSRAWPFAFLS